MTDEEACPKCEGEVTYGPLDILKWCTACAIVLGRIDQEEEAA